LLTKDRHLVVVAGRAARVVLVTGDGVDENARAVRQSLDIDWECAPFTRCLLDNTPLEPAPSHLAAEAPAGAGGPLRLCPVCRRLYWPAAMSAVRKGVSPLGSGGLRCQNMRKRFGRGR